MTEVPTHISYSQVTSYGQCPQRYYLERIEGYGNDRASWWTVGGVVVHDAVDMYNKGGISATEATDLAWEQAEIPDPDEVEVLQSRHEDLAWWKKNSYDMVANWAAWLKSSPYNVVGSEVEVKGVIGGTEIIGSVDVVLEHELSDMHMIVDLKTGRTTPSTNMQLGMYKVLLGDAYSNVEYGAFFKPRTYRPRGKPVQFGSLVGPFSLSGWTPDIIEQWITGLTTAKTHGIYPPNPSNLCPYCNVKDHCFAYQADSKGNDHG